MDMMNSFIHSVDSSSSSGSGSDSSQSSVNSEATVASNVNTTINHDVSLQITNDGGEKNNGLERGRKRKIDSGTMKAVGQGQAAENFGVSKTPLKRFCREHGMPSWPLSKHDERTMGVTDSKLSQKPESKQSLQQSSNGRVDLFGAVLLLVRIKRWSCSSKRHGCSGTWWSCGKHGCPPFKLDSMYQVARLMLSLKRWRKRHLIKHATQKNNVVASVVSDKLDGTSNKAIRKRKRAVLSFGLEKIRERCGKTMEKAVANLGVGISKLRGMCSSLGMQWWSNRKRLKSVQANVVISTSEEAPTSVFAASSEPLVTTNITHDHSTLVLHQQQTNLPDEFAQFEITKRKQFIEDATASAVKNLTIKATYKENMVKFPFTLLDGLERLKEMVATRFQLRLGSFKLKYVDEEDDMILIACDTDLMELVGDTSQPVNQPVTRLFVLPVAHV
ncbi:NIN-like protein [Artemisia annua]|uniref:NIN-like protein n=1 Tax=Artemisia annua TaxID=35608 RepID=A0A2U1QHH3_ARTAN|nr:NIN-like protein [Artemisia annua]